MQVRAQCACVQALAEFVRGPLEAVPVTAQQCVELAGRALGAGMQGVEQWLEARLDDAHHGDQVEQVSAVVLAGDQRSGVVDGVACTAGRCARVEKHSPNGLHHVDSKRIEAVVRHHRVQHERASPARVCERVLLGDESPVRGAVKSHLLGTQSSTELVQVGHDVIGRVVLAVVADVAGAAANRRRRWRCEVGEAHRLLQVGAVQSGRAGAPLVEQRDAVRADHAGPQAADEALRKGHPGLPWPAGQHEQRALCRRCRQSRRSPAAAGCRARVGVVQRHLENCAGEAGAAG